MARRRQGGRSVPAAAKRRGQRPGGAGRPPPLRASKRPEIAPGLVSTFLPSVPQQYLDVDREKVLKQGVPLNDVYRTVQAYMGGLLVNLSD